MSVTIDQELFDAEKHSYSTVGHVLQHLQRDNRLVTYLLIDGDEPDLQNMGNLRRTALGDCTVYIETANPHDMAFEVLGEVEAQLGEAERLKNDAVDLLQHNSVERAMQKLSGCFSTWQSAQESVLKTAQLLRIDLDQLRTEAGTLQEMVRDFTLQLNDIKSALMNRDYVQLADILSFEASETNNRWRCALTAMRGAVGATH